MEFGAIRKTSLVDYPAKIAVVLFTKGCNYACPYCHNPALSRPATGSETVSEEQALETLALRRKYADALVISGGEPTLHQGLRAFIIRARALGYLVKLDTNGSNPAMLKQLFDEKLLDYVALDLKAAPEDYAKATGGISDAARSVKESADAIKASGIDYEFRTTVVQGLHSSQSIKAMCQWIEGGNKLFLQRFRPGSCLEPAWNDKQPPCEKELEEMLKEAKPFFKEAGLR